MLLSKPMIKSFVEHEYIKVFPLLDEKQLRPFGLRLHLNDEILIPIPNIVIDFKKNDLDEENLYQQHNLRKNTFHLLPGKFILASSIEQFIVHPSILCWLDGRSTMARLGISVHTTSAIIDNNYTAPRSIVFEIKNQGEFTIVLRHLLPIGMLLFMSAPNHIDISEEQNQYAGQQNATPPNLRFSPPPFYEE